MENQTRTLTQKESNLVRIIGSNDFTETPGDQGWMDIVRLDSGLGGKEFSGVMSSLHKKKLVDSDVQTPQNHFGEYRDESTVWLTEQGIQVYNTLTLQGA